MKSPDTYRLELTSGVFTRVAKKLSLGESGRSHVSRVARGERRSPRVEAALAKEYGRINRLVEKYSAKLERGYELMGRAA